MPLPVPAPNRELAGVFTPQILAFADRKILLTAADTGTGTGTDTGTVLVGLKTV